MELAEIWEPQRWNAQMAGALMAAMPTLLLLLGRYFMRGLLAGALKG